jgi:rare lipoprotein A
MRHTAPLLAAPLALVLASFASVTDAAKGKQCEKGKASYYQRCFKTCATASGERFKPDGISVAHRTLAFGTVLSVRNENNGRVVKVKVTDRGPFVTGRHLDLSRGAMRKLDGIDAGVIPVTFCVVR